MTKEDTQSHRGNPNTMGYALFKALAADEWYVNGGWRGQARRRTSINRPGRQSPRRTT
jgi:hypothetical protein